MKITWLNQGGFLFENSSGTRLVVDVYLSDIVEQLHGVTRIFHSTLDLCDIRPDLYLSTHDHLDHFDPPTAKLAAVSFEQCHFIGPESVCEHIEKLRISKNRIIPFDVNDKIEVGSFKLEALPAFHTDSAAIGVLIESDNQRIYLSGDTELTDDLKKNCDDLREIDVMLICINGKLGNMNYSQAAELSQIVGPGIAIPMHYGLFAENTVNPELFLESCEKFNLLSATLVPERVYELTELFAGK